MSKQTGDSHDSRKQKATQAVAADGIDIDRRDTGDGDGGRALARCRDRAGRNKGPCVPDIFKGND